MLKTSQRLIWNFSADGVVHTRLPMRPLPTGMPSSLRVAGYVKSRSPPAMAAGKSTSSGSLAGRAWAATREIARTKSAGRAIARAGQIGVRTGDGVPESLYMTRRYQGLHKDVK